MIPSQPNPYHAPRDINDWDELAGTPHDGPWLHRIDFQTDWSREGLQARCSRSGYRVIDGTFAVWTAMVLAIFIAEITLRRGLGSGGAVSCPLILIWIVTVIGMLSSLVYRFGNALGNAAPGLAGRVRGRVDGPWVCLMGPHMSVTVRGEDCPSWRVEPERTTFTIPQLAEKLFVWTTDVTSQTRYEAHETIASLAKPIGNVAAAKTLVERTTGMIDELADLSFNGNQTRRSWHFAGGDVRASDFAGTGIWRWWVACVVFTLGVAALALGGAALTFARLPTWARNPPSHYLLSTAEYQQFNLVAIGVLIGGIAAIMGLANCYRLFWQRWRYQVAITHDQVLIATPLVCYGYHGDGLNEFVWTRNGLAVFQESGFQPIFLLPTRWFDAETEKFIATRFNPHSKAGQVTASQKLFVLPKL